MVDAHTKRCEHLCFECEAPAEYLCRTCHNFFCGPRGCLKHVPSAAEKSADVLPADWIKPWEHRCTITASCASYEYRYEVTKCARGNDNEARR